MTSLRTFILAIFYSQMYKDLQYNLSILWLTNSLSFLKPSGFKISSSLTTIAFSKLPPFANPFFLINSISSNKQNVLEL